MRISVNPKLRAGFYCTDNNKRSDTEMRRWWCNPFVASRGNGYGVECLDGGAWDRPTFHAYYDTLSQALHHAKTLKESLKDDRYKGGAL